MPMLIRQERLQKFVKGLGLDCTVKVSKDFETHVTMMGYKIELEELIQPPPTETYYPKTRVAARFYLCEMPGCCGVLMFHHAWATFDIKHLLAVATSVAQDNRFGMIQATVREEPQPNLKMAFEADGWNIITEFKNPKYGTQSPPTIRVWGRKLEYEGVVQI
jgi:hypothetical protein